MSQNLIKKYTQMATPTKGYTQRPGIIQKSSPSKEPYKRTVSGVERNYELQRKSLNRSNSNELTSMISMDQENDLRGEISNCKEEVDYLKKEIRKFNEVLKTKIIMDEEEKRFRSKSRSGRKRKLSRGTHERNSRSPDQSSIILHTVNKHEG